MTLSGLENGCSAEPEPGASKDTILLIEDSSDHAALVTRWLERSRGAQVVHAHSAEMATRLLDSWQWSLVICDVELPGMDGLDFIEQSRAHSPWTPTLVITANQSFAYAQRAVRQRVDELLIKPLVREPFLERVDALIQAGRDERHRRQSVVLAIGAHPDDVEIGCGGILLRHRAHGDAVIVLTLTGGDKGGSKSARIKESQAAARLIGAELVMGDLPDTRVSEGLETISLIEATIRRYAPTTIYTHTLNDAHQDHRATHRATLVAARGVPNLCCYQSPSSTVDFRPTLFVDVGDHLDRKLDAIRAYGSQAAQRPYLVDDRIIATSHYWGRFSSYRPVEPLEVVRRSE